MAGEAAAAERLMVWRDVNDLAGQIHILSEAFPPEDHDWLTEPLRHAARSTADRIAHGWHARRDPEAMVDHLTAAEADLHEVQTWTLLAMRHHHWSPDVADEIDHRCEAIHDALSDMVHYAARWCGPAVEPLRMAA